MGLLPIDEKAQGSIDTTSINKKRRKPLVGGPMNLEE
jgi:hypothetical protein